MKKTISMSIKKRGRPKLTKPSRRRMVPAWFDELLQVYSWEKIEELLKNKK